MRRWLSLFLSTVVVSCADSSSPRPADSGDAGSGALPCEVQDLLVSRCQQCHSDPPQFGAPMPMVTRAHLLARTPTDPSMTVGAKSLVRMKDDAKPMPQPPNPRATDAEFTTLKAWVDGGMGASTQTCGAGGSGAGGSAGAAGSAGSAGKGSSCTPDVMVRAKTPWTIKQDVVDRYVCFGGKIPANGKKRQITQVGVEIENKAHAHHLCVYDMGAGAVSEDPVTCSAGSGVAGGKLIYCWAPGADPNTLPPEAGFPISADQDTNILIEMHYSNIQQSPDSTDNSAATFCTTEELRPYDADVMAFGHPSFKLPPAQSTTAESVFTLKDTLASDGWLRVVRGWPHMHLLGVAQSTTVTRDGAVIGDLGSTTTYSFENQIGYPVDVMLKPGDVITTKCVFNNTTSSSVSYGENTESEMCYNFVTYYPRITNPKWVWAAPGYLAKNSTYPTP